MGKEETVLIKLPRSANGDDAVFVSVGDRSWRIKRGVEVNIPRCAYEVLRCAESADEYALKYIESQN